MRTKMFLCRTFTDNNYATDFRKGRLRLFSPTYYRSLEKDTTGRLDKYDGKGYKYSKANALYEFLVGSELDDDKLVSPELVIAPLNNSKEPNYNQVIPIQNGSFTFYIHSTANQFYKLQCLSMIKADEGDNIIDFNERIDEFGDHTIVVTNTPCYISKVLRIAELEIVCSPVIHAPVKYCDLDSKEGAINPFEKDKYFSYQLEYRFCIVLKEKHPDPLLIDIGDISDISVSINTNQIKDATKINDLIT